MSQWLCGSHVKMERFVIIVNGWKPLAIITKHSILDVATVLDPPLVLAPEKKKVRYVTPRHEECMGFKIVRM